jgi:signal transduction histidine kinase/ActR/RegA family two-component response regulator
MKNRTETMRQTFRYKYAIIFGLTSVLPLLLFLFAAERYGIVQEGGVALLLGGSLVLALTGLIYALRIVNQVNTLARDFVKVEQGDLDELGERDTSSELSEMARIADSFNKTLGDLKVHAEELENLFAKLNTLSDLIELVSRIPNIKEIFEIMLRRTMAALNAGIGSVMLLDEQSETLKIVCAEGLDQSIVAKTIVGLGDRIAGKVAETGEAILVEDVETDARLRKPNDPKYESASFISMPLRARGKVMGVLNLSKRGDKKAFTESDMSFLTSLIGHISFALDNARLIEEAKEAANRLEEVVEHQSLELHQVRDQAAQSTKLFQHAQKMEAVGTLAGGIAHDFNNLLMGIQGRASLLLMGIDSRHPHYGHLSGIESMAKKGADLTKQLLGFARGGKYEVKPTDLNDLIRDQNRMFGRTKREITIREECEEGIWPAEVDHGQIEQVLLNVYLNAWQAMPGGGDLLVRTQNYTLDENETRPFRVKPGKYVRISVTDTGVGMDEAVRQRAFEPFFTTKELGGGSGLGLASAYGIIKNHKGIINLLSEPGYGTTVEIYLPACDRQVTEVKRTSGEILQGTETVLLVDDEETIVEVGKEMLEAVGYKVLVASSGEEALSLYRERQNEIDLVVLDMIMPDMGGGKVYDGLKEINPGVKVLLSSGYSANGEADEILERGCDGFIQKPFNMKKLSVKLRKVLDRE